MKIPPLHTLESRQELSDFLFHVKGILEAQAQVAALLKEVDEKLEVDPAAAAKSLSFLEVEVFDHLGYHLAELREPFSKFLEYLYTLDSTSEG